MSFIYLYKFQGKNESNLKSIMIIKQIQNMNLKLNMKDINKILAKAHFKSKYKQKCEKKTHFYKNMSL
jgi:hypothetical protein